MHFAHQVQVADSTEIGWVLQDGHDGSDPPTGLSDGGSWCSSSSTDETLSPLAQKGKYVQQVVLHITNTAGFAVCSPLLIVGFVPLPGSQVAHQQQERISGFSVAAKCQNGYKVTIQKI